MSSRDNGSPPRGPRSESFTPGARSPRTPAGGVRPIGGAPSLEPIHLEPEALEELDDFEDLGADALSDPDDGPAFVVLVEGAPPRWFVANDEDLSIGRGGEADIPVGHKTVSRQHCSIAVIPDEGVVIEDLESDNGTFVNGERIERARVTKGDKIQLGTLDIVYVGDDGDGRLYKGQPVTSLERFERTADSSRHEATFAMSVTLMRRMKAVRELLGKAQMLRTSTNEGWKLGSHTFHFGRKNPDVAVKGWFVSHELATVSWTGRKHRLRKVGKWGKVLINDQPAEMKDLENGDTLRIGNSTFQYTVDS